MVHQRRTRILVVTDHAEPSDALLEAIAQRAELHLLHPERHDKAQEAELVLRQALPLLERAAGGPVIGTVSVRNDPMDAIEETMFSEPIDEIMIAVAPHGLSTWLHQDLAHRLQHFGLPVTTVTAGTPAR